VPTRAFCRAAHGRSISFEMIACWRKRSGAGGRRDDGQPSVSDRLKAPADSGLELLADPRIRLGIGMATTLITAESAGRRGAP